MKMEKMFKMEKMAEIERMVLVNVHDKINHIIENVPEPIGICEYDENAADEFEADEFQKLLKRLSIFEEADKISMLEFKYFSGCIDEDNKSFWGAIFEAEYAASF
jgi:hypothetical protein